MPKLINFTISLLMIYFLFRFVWWAGKDDGSKKKKEKKIKEQRDQRWNEEFDEMEDELEDLGW